MGRLDRWLPFAHARRRQAGGFLLELSLVLLVVGVLTVGAFEVQSTLRKRQQTTDAKSLLLTIDATLRAFVVREHRLPCPAQGGSGVEARLAGGRCSVSAGDVPFITLGMEMPRRQDVAYRYGVAAVLTGGGPGFLNQAEAASRALPNIERPYVALRDDQQFFGRCGAALFNPVYALMWMPSPGPGVLVPPLCFRENADQSMGLLAVSGQEFLGWLQVNLRQ